MTSTAKKMILASMIASGGVALASIIDMAVDVPFAGQPTLDVMLLISAGLVGYLGYDAYKDLV